jgi:hypothetical protein
VSGFSRTVTVRLNGGHYISVRYTRRLKPFNAADRGRRLVFIALH